MKVESEERLQEMEMEPLGNPEGRRRGGRRKERHGRGGRRRLRRTRGISETTCRSRSKGKGKKKKKKKGLCCML